MSPAPELAPALARIESLVAEIERTADPAARERSRALVQALLDVHRLALERLLELAAARAGGPELLDELATDQAVALLFSLHGLHRRDLDSRVGAAIDELRPKLLADGVALDLEAIADDRVRVRVSPAAGGRVRAGSAQVRATIESHLMRAVPEIASVDIDGLETGVVSIGLGPRQA
jgi:hypothetical protein